MAYTKTTWVNGTAPAINATNLNKIEQGIADALPLDGSVDMTGKLINRGNAITPIISSSGITISDYISGICHQPNSAYAATGASRTYYTGVLSAPIITNDGTGGSNFSVGYGIISSPVLLSSSSSARVGLIGGVFAVQRASANDLSTSTGSYITGVSINAQQGINAGAGVVNGSISGIQILTISSAGTTTDVYGVGSTVRQGSTTTSLVNSTTNVYSGQFNIVAGSTTGGATTITNAYGLYTATTNSASATITNLYSVYIGALTNTGTVTNKWALYSADATLPSYHAGNFLIGYTTSNGAYPLQVNGQIFATSSTIATSDARYKKDVVSITGALDIVTKLNPVKFNWKEHPAHNFNTSIPTVGFIAQEVAEVLKDQPYLNSVIKKSECTWETETGEFESVNEVEKIENEDGTFEYETKQVLKPIKEKHTEEFYGIAESNLIAILTKAIQELNAKVEALEAKLNQ